MNLKEIYQVEKITSSECKEWFLQKHYLKRLASFTYCFGLYKNKYLEGVCSYGRPVAHSLIKGAFNGKYQNNFLELNRLIINENNQKNLLSFFLGTTLKLLPKPLIVVSYADQSQGHHGYIYQATNWTYTGLSAKRKDYKIKGVNLHGSSLLDREGRDFGRGKIEIMRQKYGDKLYTEERPRKHRYFYFLGNKKEKQEIKSNLQYKVKPYPKGDNKKYDASYIPATQGLLFS